MIPTVSNLLNLNLDFASQPTLTYRMELDTEKRIRGHTDGKEAMKQAIYKILNTERYRYIMYSWNYGIELIDLYGQPTSYVCPELERRITEALMQDDRVSGVSDFEFTTPEKGTIHVTFTVHTRFGDIEAERTVDI